jgi:hypothetical protein
VNSKTLNRGRWILLIIITIILSEIPVEIPDILRVIGDETQKCERAREIDGDEDRFIYLGGPFSALEVSELNCSRIGHHLQWNYESDIRAILLWD